MHTGVMHLKCPHARGLRARKPRALHLATCERVNPWHPLSQTAHRRVRCSPVCSSKTEDAESVEVGWLWTLGKNGAASTKVALRSEKLKAKKSLGQNFLTDDRILSDIVAAAGVKQGEVVIEVGPGTGNLTRHLVKTGARITAIEKDDVLVEKLQAMYNNSKTLKFIHGDVLRVKLANVVAELLEGQGMAGGKVKIVANLPYNITKEFLQLVLPMGDRISDVHLMIQDEVARRLLVSKPGGPTYRSMNIFTHFYSQPQYRFRIPRTKYYPVPGVDGALVTFRLRPPSVRVAVPTEKYFLMLVNKAFSQRRKMMHNSMQPLLSVEQVKTVLAQLGLPVDCRAQDLTVDNFAAFARLAHQLYPPSKPAAATPGGQSAAPGSESASPGSEPAAPSSESAARGSESAAPGSKSAAPGSESAARSSESASCSSESASRGSESAAPQPPGSRPPLEAAAPAGIAVHAVQEQQVQQPSGVQQVQQRGGEQYVQQPVGQSGGQPGSEADARGIVGVQQVGALHTQGVVAQAWSDDDGLDEAEQQLAQVMAAAPSVEPAVQSMRREGGTAGCEPRPA